MSAYLCDFATFDLLTSAAVEYGLIDHVIAADWAAGLYLQNLASIHARYPDTIDHPEDMPGNGDETGRLYAYTPVEVPDGEAVDDAARCYAYQSCETGDYDETAVGRLVTAIREEAVRRHAATTAMIPPAPPESYSETASAKESVALLRQALKAEFPATRFSVRMDRGTAYGYANVRWADGPTVAAVREITDTYEGQGLDGSTDSTYHIRAIMSDGRQSGCRGISESRHLSPGFVTRLIAAVGAFYGVPATAWPTAEEYERGALGARSLRADDQWDNYHNWQEAIWRAAGDRQTVTA